MKHFHKNILIAIVIFLIILSSYFIFYNKAYYTTKCKGDIQRNTPIDDTNSFF